MTFMQLSTLPRQQWVCQTMHPDYAQIQQLHEHQTIASFRVTDANLWSEVPAPIAPYGDQGAINLVIDVGLPMLPTFPSILARLLELPRLCCLVRKCC